MAGANIKMGVTGVSEFTRDIGKIRQSMKTLDAALELSEKQFKATGNAEEYLKTKSELLKTKLEQQKSIIKDTEAALDKMKKNGTDKASKSFQDMQRNLLKAKSEMIETQTQLNTLGTNAGEAKDSAQQMNSELKKIGKGVGFENVTSGLKGLTDNLEKAGKAAIRVAKTVARSAMDSTAWADDLIKRSTQMGVDVETLQKMERVAELIDTDVDTIVTAQDKLAKNRGNVTELLGIETEGKDPTDLLFEVGEALSQIGDEMDRSEAAQQIFGKSWRELAPLFAAGKEEYNSLMESQNVLTEEQVKKLGEADDAIKKVQAEIENMKNMFWADNADKITDMLQWVVDNKDAVTAALVAIGVGFAGLKLAETAANVMKVVEGFKTLGLLGGAGKAAGAAAGAAGAGGAGGGAGVSLAGLGGAAVPLGVTALALAPALLANEQTYANAREKQAARVANASKLSGNEAWFLEQSANALGITDGRLGNYGAIQDLLMGMGRRSGIEMSKLHNLLNGSVTSQGNYTWNELQRLWGGEEMDMGRMTAILESVTDAYNRMAEMSEELAGGKDRNKTNSEMAEAVQGLSGLPQEMAAAVSKAQINVNIDGQVMTNYFNSQLGPALDAASE